MQLPLTESKRSNGIATLTATLPPQTEAVSLGYKTWTGGLLRVDGIAAGAYDREHHEVVLPPSDRDRVLALDVELDALPTNGLPSGPGIWWWYLNKRSHQEPGRVLVVEPYAEGASTGSAVVRQAHHDNRDLMLLGHSHLDVAWLWTYEQTRRKAQRTFAIACDLLDRDPEFVFIQSQPQLYAFVEQDDPQLFERVREHVASNRFDPDVAALWVESDCNVPSGESLLRQMIYGHAYCKERFGITPGIAWLPDTFGFANTVPQLLAHAGIHYFSTTKLQWNDTTKFPYPQFVWQGPDGSRVVSALIQSYDGGPYPWRVVKARERREPIVLGYGDGGGGVTSKMLEQAQDLGKWIHPRAWFDELNSRRDELPVHSDELYLEYHRGVYTTHHDVKFHNALLERALNEAEELLSWCIAVHAPREAIAEFRSRLHSAWETVLRNQFHDVIPGTSITPVYADALSEYAQAEELVASVITSAQAILPRARGHEARAKSVEPQEHEGDYVFENGLLRAQVSASGSIFELSAPGARTVCSQGNVLALYRDKPKQWEAWNVDRDYKRNMRHARPRTHRLDDGALLVDFLFGASPASMRITLNEGEPFLRVDLDVDWSERRTLLRVENWLPLRTESVTYGSPHGTITRTARAQTPAEQAKFEVPGQRFASVNDGDGSGVALLALDSYGWSARKLPKGGVQLGHSLLRGTTWPDAQADIGEHHLAYAYAPLSGRRIGALERAWLQFVHEPRVRLFTCDDENVLVVACKPAEDGNGVVVRVRECDGAEGPVRLRCGARMTEAIAVDGLERPIESGVTIDQETVVFELGPYQLRSFRIRFTHA